MQLSEKQDFKIEASQDKNIAILKTKHDL